MVNKKNSNFINRFLITFFLAPIIIYIIILGGWYLYALSFLIFLFALKEILNLKNLLLIFFVFVLLILFLISYNYIRNSNNGLENSLFLIFVTWMSDIGGYLFGKIFKGKKINIISPNKTYLGFLGSILFAQITHFYLYYYNVSFEDTLIYNSLIIMFASIIVIVGDLLFSYIKRFSDIKDFSNLLPGHGGILDRIDGLIILTILFSLYLN